MVFTLRCVSSPIVADGMVFVTCGQGGNGKLLIAVDQVDNAEEPQEVYRLEAKLPQCADADCCRATCCFCGKIAASCRATTLATGKQHFRERVGGDYHSSPMRIGNRIFWPLAQGRMRRPRRRPRIQITGAQFAQ